MSLSPAIIDAMVAAGATAEVLAAAMKADLLEREGAMSAKRERDAERQRRHRERNAVSRDVTVTECDSVTEPSLSRPLPSPQTPQLTPTHTHPEYITPRVRAEKLARPEDVSEQVWSDWLVHRKSKKSAVSQTVLSTFRREADRVGWSLEQAMVESISRDWRGFKADWIGNGKQRCEIRRGSTAGNGRSALAQAIDEGLEFLGGSA